MPLSVTYAFPGGAGVVADPPWTQLGGANVEQNGAGVADVDSVTTDDCIVIWNEDVFPDDQLVQVKSVQTLNGTGTAYIELLVRSDGTASVSGTYYQVVTDGGSDTKLRSIIAGVQTQLGAADGTLIAAGDVLQLEANGTAITFRVNGVDIIGVTDVTVTSGQPGFGLFSAFGQGVAQIQDFAATGDGSAPGTHTLSGRGNITITSPAFLSTSLSGTFPVFATTGQAEPPNYYHVGMISWGTTANGAMVAYPVTRIVDLVQLPAGMDTLWYEFVSGVIAVVTELATP